ncbi:BrxA family protein [Nitrospira sp. Kam-Ns4a]
MGRSLMAERSRLDQGGPRSMHGETSTVEDVMVREQRKQITAGETLRLPAAGGVPAAGMAALRWGRDLGTVSTRNSSKGALVAEARSVFRAFNGDTPLEKFREQCLRGAILRQRARETRHRIWEALHWRFFAWNPPRWVLEELAEAAAEDSTSRFVGLVYVHYARRDRLTFEFVTGKLWEMWHNKTMEVRRNDVLDFLAAYQDQHPQVRTWRESTRKKLAGNVLSALRDFGILKGVQRKVIEQPIVPLEVALHLCRLLYGEGLRGRSLLEARDWRLFLWESHQAAGALSQLAQQGKLRFERSGRTVILEVPEPGDGGER